MKSREGLRNADLVGLAMQLPYGSSGYSATVGSIVEAYLPIIKGWATRFDSACDSDDVAQEVSIKIFTCLHGLRDPTVFRTWLYRVTLNECTSQVRANRHLRHAYPLQDAHAAEVDTVLAEYLCGSFDFRNAWESRIVLGEYVQQLFDALTKEEQGILVLRYVEGVSIEELALRLGIPDGTLKSKTGRACSKAQVKSSQLLQQPA